MTHPDKELAALEVMVETLKPLDPEQRIRALAAAVIVLGLVSVPVCEEVLSAFQRRGGDGGTPVKP